MIYYIVANNLCFLNCRCRIYDFEEGLSKKLSLHLVIILIPVCIFFTCYGSNVILTDVTGFKSSSQMKSCVVCFCNHIADGGRGWRWEPRLKNKTKIGVQNLFSPFYLFALIKSQTTQPPPLPPA